MARSDAAPRATIASIAALVRDGIYSGKYPPGSRLRPSKELAAENNVSKPTVSFAYQLLAAEGLVRGESGVGTFVQPRFLYEVAVTLRHSGDRREVFLRADALTLTEGLARRVRKDRAWRGAPAVTAKAGRAVVKATVEAAGPDYATCLVVSAIRAAAAEQKWKVGTPVTVREAAEPKVARDAARLPSREP